MKKSFFLNEELYKFRKLKGLSQEELAAQIGVSRQIVSHWENGTNTPDLENLLKICKVLEIDIKNIIKNDTPSINNQEKKHKHKHKHSKTIKQLLKYISIILIILLLTHLLFSILKLITFKSIHSNYSHYYNSNNYYLKINNYNINQNKPNYFHTIEIYYKNNIAKMTITTQLNNSSEPSIGIYLNDYNNNISYILDQNTLTGNKQKIISKDTTFPNHNSLLSQKPNLYDKDYLLINILNALNPFNTITLNNNTYIYTYSANGFKNSTISEYINKDTGLLTKKIQHFNDEDIIHEYEMQINTVTDENLEIPNLNLYEIK